MAINFPDSPTSGDIYTVNGKKWQWDGTTWNVVTSVGATNSLSDTDSDTKIVLEETPDSDTIVFTTAATPRFEITSSGHIIPSDNETYDLGSASNRFRDLYLSGSSITLGDASLTSHFSGLNVHSFIADNHVDAPAYYINDIASISDDSNYLKLDPNGSRVLGVHVNNNLDVVGNITGTLKSPYELWSVVSGAPGTGASHPIDLLTATAWYYTSNNTGHFEFNFRGDASTTLDSLMVLGEAVTTSVLVTNGATPYYNTNTLVDGVSQTVEWQNAAAPSAGNANQIDTYTFTIIKTASETFTVLGSFTTFG